MVKLSLALCVVLMAGLALFGAAPVGAATPTPTPTLIPIQPSPTSNTQYLRPTPTAWTLSTPAFNLSPMSGINGQAGAWADTTINVYNSVNQNHIIDLIAGAAVAFAGIVLVLGLFFYITGKD